MNIEKQKLLKYGIKDQRLLILGDNEPVLNELANVSPNSVDLVYIDPPYNRGDIFKYYNDSKNHDKWLHELKSVIANLYMLLKEDGSLWISIDDAEMAYLKVCCDSIFGRKNFVSTIIWQKRNTRENRNIFSNNHEYILVYAKDYYKFKKKRNLLPATMELNSRYKNPDNDKRGPWQSVTLSVQAGHAVKSQFYTIVSPSGKKHNPPKGRCWIYNKKKMEDEISKNNIWFGKDGNSVPRLKKFYNDSKHGIVPETIWLADFAGTTKDAKKELLELNIYDEDVFDTPKPELLLYRIMQIATKPNDMVLDCYSGSGTTLAVAHKINRNYIGIDIDNRTTKYAKARLKKVCNGDTGGISSKVEWCGSGDFKSFKW